MSSAHVCWVPATTDEACPLVLAVTDTALLALPAVSTMNTLYE